MPIAYQSGTPFLGRSQWSCDRFHDTGDFKPASWEDHGRMDMEVWTCLILLVHFQTVQNKMDDRACFGASDLSFISAELCWNASVSTIFLPDITIFPYHSIWPFQGAYSSCFITSSYSSSGLVSAKAKRSSRSVVKRPDSRLPDRLVQCQRKQGEKKQAKLKWE